MAQMLALPVGGRNAVNVINDVCMHVSVHIQYIYCLEQRDMLEWKEPQEDIIGVFQE